MNHLTDRDLQNYLDHPGQPEIEDHLAVCSACRAQANLYKQIFAGLKEETPIELPANFSSLVIDRIESYEEKQARWMEWLFLGIAAACGLAITVYYSSIAMSAESLAAWMPVMEWKALAELLGDKLGALIGSHFHFLIFGLFILLLIDWMDKKFIRARLQGPR